MAQRLAGEIMDAMNGQGGACKKREDTHKMAGQQGFCPFQMVIPATTAFLLFFAPVGIEFANLLGGHYAKRCILRENA